MAENKPMPKTQSLGELVDLFDNNDLGDYIEHMPEAEFNVAIKRRTHLVTLDADLAHEVETIAKAQRISSEMLIHKWLQEKIREYAA